MSKSVARPGYRYLFSNPTFGLLWAGQAVSTLGDALYDIALLWYVLDSTGSALAAGGIAAGATAGRLAGSVSAGAVLDRLHTRQVMLGADLARLALTLGLSTVWLLGWVPPLGVLYALAFAVAFGTAYFNPARAATVPHIVPRQHLIQANALDAVSHSLVVTTAWALSGVIVAAVGPAISLLLDGGTFLASYLFVRAAHWQLLPSGERLFANPLREALRGVRWATSSALVRTVLSVETMHALAAGFFVAGLAPFIREMGGGAALYGAQGGVFGAGLLVASSAIGYMSTREVGRLYAGGVSLNGIGNTAFGLAPAPGWLLPPVFVAGLGAPGWGTGRQSILQAYVPPEVRGRIFALLDTLSNLMVLPAFLMGGWAADRLGARAVVIAASGVHVCLGLYLWSSPRLRNITLDEKEE